MIADTLLTFCEDKDMSAAITGDVLDLKQEYPNLGSLVKPFYLIIVAKDAAGAGTVTFKVQDSADGKTFADAAAYTVTGSSIQTSQAFPMPVKHRRYLKFVTTVSGTVSGTLQKAVLNNVYELPATAKFEGYEQAKTID